jgi:hypothetical protein
MGGCFNNGTIDAAEITVRSGGAMRGAAMSVYATLHGSLFAISDADLLSYRTEFGYWHPFRIPDTVPDSLQHVKRALEILREPSRRRNYIPIAETVNRLLSLTRAHAGFVMRPGGEQALANVLHVAELARQYEANHDNHFFRSQPVHRGTGGDLYCNSDSVPGGRYAEWDSDVQGRQYNNWNCLTCLNRKC